ncbi:hypothetical protein ACFX2F_025204 [Malus domestica]
MSQSISRIMANDLLQGVPQLEQPFCEGGGQIASSKLQNPKPPKRPKRQRRRVLGSIKKTLRDVKSLKILLSCSSVRRSPRSET